MGYAESTDENAYTYDPELAQQYLDAWGGDPSTVSLDIICSNDTKTAIATIIQAELAELGINVNIEETDDATYQAAMRTTDLTSAIVSWSPANAMTYVQRFHSDRRNQTCFVFFNFRLYYTLIVTLNGCTFVYITIVETTVSCEK